MVLGEKKEYFYNLLKLFIKFHKYFFPPEINPDLHVVVDWGCWE